MRTYGRGIYKIADEIAQHRDTAQPYSLTFAPTANMTIAEKRELEDYLKYHFKLWFDSYIIPPCNELKAKITR